VVISFLPTPLIQSVIEALDPEAVFYYCANDMASGSSGARKLRTFEDRFLTRADAVICTSHALEERARHYNPNVTLVPSGVDLAKFMAPHIQEQVPDDVAAIPAPRAGYVGTIGHVFDQALVCAAARALPAVHFVLIGPISVNVSAMRVLPNIHLLGPKPHDIVPSCINAFDVTLIPYERSRFTESVNSCKLNEYLAVGKCVVSTDLLEMRRYACNHPGVIEIASDGPQFIAALQSALAQTGDEEAQARRKTAARLNSWEIRFRDLFGVIHKVISAKRKAPPRWEARMERVLRTTRRRAITGISTLATMYLLMFHTPLLWWLGQQLVVQQPPSPVAEAIVVFSGDGEPGYVNAAYQRRAAEALRLYQRGFGRVIILSSGKRFAMAETDVIRAILNTGGIPDTFIYSIEGTPRSTRENVLMASDLLKRLHVDRVNLVTAPLHSRRAVLVWAQAAPAVHITAVVSPLESSKKPSRRVSMGTVRVIAFEYAAMVYYRVKGWL
jgi:uncharacterized SAM-binding protein YcdF (DUF218 family)